MTLQEAIASGKKFNRITGLEDEFFTAAEFLEGGLTLEDYSATDFVLMKDEPKIVTMALLAEAWNSSKGTRTTVASAAQSQFFKDFTATLKNFGVAL